MSNFNLKGLGGDLDSRLEVTSATLKACLGVLVILGLREYSQNQEEYFSLCRTSQTDSMNVERLLKTAKGMLRDC